MSTSHPSPQDAEDAYYDAIDDQDLEAMMSVWEESDETLCLLPMMPAQRGTGAIRQCWEPFLQGDMKFDIEIKHLSWIESGEIAIHLVEERVKVPGQGEPQSVYASNIFRKGSEGWRLLMHQNSPTPPPPGLQMPEMG
ncbi:MAG: nuclear transport factor 2 family protein [Candidatus Thiodiazotropha sp. (ex Monitilora ramsayi)]|nr:nuclear transport factor 2 family protein [Candidatus Thiodiazotropha sp. (ex Monitilora ramsayi)]